MHHVSGYWQAKDDIAHALAWVLLMITSHVLDEGVP
jgi:hypothetical protein